MSIETNQLEQLGNTLDGSLHYDHLMRTIYATDASVYRAFPLAVAIPKSIEDLKKIMAFTTANSLSIIPRAAGTSLAGQCVGNGIVVDISQHFNQILELNVEEKWVRVQPGVVRDQLNNYLQPFGLFFGPNTSTANRCTIGGMVGNNSCGSTSIVYGSTRDHVLELKTILSDTSEVTFQSLSEEEFQKKQQEKTLEGAIYAQIAAELNIPEQQNRIKESFPKPSIHRRNTGYAVDLLLHQKPFNQQGEPFNFCKLLCGSEGTLALTTEIKIHVDPLPLPHSQIICPHFNSIDAALRAVQVAMKFAPSACELMDKIILDCTKENLAQQKNRFFIEGDPAAILMIEVRADAHNLLEEKSRLIIESIKDAGYGYAFPIVGSKDAKKVWDLRKAGLGVLANLPGDPKAVACIEDTAVGLEDLPEFIADFTEMLDGYGQESVYYAHAGAGEIHLRPILDLKKKKDQTLFYNITKSTAELVKRYNGSLSGEHGDGRVRASFIPLMVGPENYELFKRIKKQWDPNNILNPGKIVDAPPMTEDLRYEPDQETKSFETILDFSETGGLLRMAEKCNGSGDCRKLPESGGTMCPSYMATRNEKDTTRARANTMREILTRSKDKDPFDSKEIFEVMKLCLSCKGCTSECPSNVDMAALKAEFLHQYYQSNRRPISNLAFGHFATLAKWTMPIAPLANVVLSTPGLKELFKSILSVAPKRELPKFSNQSLRTWYRKQYRKLPPPDKIKGQVYLFCDEFTDYNDAAIGRKVILLLHRLGYQVELPKHDHSGRAPLSKGLLKNAKSSAHNNIEIFSALISEETPLVGIEPSAILSFVDEYPKLVKSKNLIDKAHQIGNNTFMVEAFIQNEAEKGNITPSDFDQSTRTILLHGHCHQKALSSVAHSAFALSIPTNHNVQIIPSGCCGMAGSFGYEKENYQISMDVGELVLFPSIRAANPDTIIAAPGTSCRHQIKDGTQRSALHPAEILFNALKSK